MFRRSLKLLIAVAVVFGAVGALTRAGQGTEPAGSPVLTITPVTPATQPTGFTIHGKVTVAAGWGMVKPDLSRAIVFLASDPALEAPAPSNKVCVAQRNKAFVPNFVVVPVGTCVEFPNWDKFDHNVFSRSKAAPAFDLDRYPYGQSKSRIFDKIGVVQVFCNIHPSMRAMIYVTPNRFFARADGEGRFEITGVPPGTFQLAVFHERCQPQQAAVDVGAGVPADVTIALEESRGAILANDPPQHAGGYGIERGLGAKREQLNLPVVKESHPAEPQRPTPRDTDRPSRPECGDPMRFRTKLLLTGGGVVLLLWIGTLAAVRHTIAESSNRMADLDFEGTRKSLDGLRAERVARMRQAGSLVMSIPELRALIAEHNYEVSAENTSSLQERLDNLRDMLHVTFICVLDAHGALVAQNHASPWKDLADLDRYLTQRTQARALVQGIFSPASPSARNEGEYALWEHDGRLYEVVGQTLVFNGDGTSGADGALIMAAPLTDQLASDLGASHNCQVSFLAEGKLAACSVPVEYRAELVTKSARLSSGTAADMQVGGVNYHSFLEDLNDPCSHERVGRMLIQCSLADAEAASRHVSNRLVLIMGIGLGLAALVSLPLSAAVTRPVQQLVQGARQVAGGDLHLALPDNRNDELGELARAFNDMIVQLRTREELRRIAETSQAASKAKSQFLANMSHEIRTPLNGVIGVADLLLRTELPPKQKRYAALIKSSAEVLTTLINDILDFSKIEAGKLELEALPFELRTVADDVVELMTPRASAKSLRVVCRIDPGVPPALRGDPNRLRQILMNLIGNAIKFTETGEVRLVVTYDAESAGGLARFEVQDTGIGIPPERMDRLFKSFSQVDSSTTRRYGGTGLGLVICKQLAELMGGRIGVESQPGRGSTFWFTAALSAVDKSLVAQRAAVTVASPAAKNVRILLAEDNEVNQIVAADLLAEAGYACDIVTDGRQAVEAAMTGRYDLILMDCQMPLKDGFEASTEIRKREQSAAGSANPGRRIPIIALTANAAEGDRERCLSAGMDDHCGKPFDTRLFLGKIAALLPATPSSAAGALTGGVFANPTAGKGTGGTTPPIDIESLLKRCSGKPALAKVVLDKFEKQIAEISVQLDECERAADIAQLARTAHMLKGTAGIVAAAQLSRLCARLEDLGNAGDAALALQALGDVRDEIRRCIAYSADKELLPKSDKGANPCAS